MKLPVILYVVLTFFNLFSLYLILDAFLGGGMEDFLRYDNGRFVFYILYLTILLNLYFLCYIAIRIRFEE